MLEQWQQEEITELVLDFANGNRTGYLDDAINELVDGYIPVYNNQIIEEWQKMPNEYDNEGAEQLGIPDPVSIINLMQLDLYVYYSELVRTYANQVIDQVGEELEYV